MVEQSNGNVERRPLDAERRTDTFFLRSLTACCPVGIFATDTDGYCTYVNPRCQSINGFLIEQSLGKSWTQFVHPDERESVLAEWLDQTHNASEFSRQYRFQTPQGTSRWVSVRSAPLLDEQGNRIGYVNTVDDFTEYKQAEENTRQLAAQIQEQANVLNAILSASVDHIYIFDGVGRYQYVSQGGASVIGYKPEDLVGKTWRDLNLAADIMKQVDAQRDAVMATGQPIRSETDYIALDGMHYYEYIMTPWRSSDQTINGVIAISRDITERKRAEEALRLSEERFRVTLKSVPLTLAHMDRELRFTWLANTPPEFPPETVIGKKDTEIFPPEVAELFVRLKLGVLESGVGIRQEVWVKFGGQNHAYDLTVEPLCDQTGAITGLTEVALDITERRRTEEALRESEERFRKFFEQAPIGISVIDLNGRFLQANKTYCQMLGYSEQELCQLTFAQITHPEDVEADIRYIQRLFTGEISSHQIEKRYLTKTGEVVWVNLTSTAIFDQQGQPRYGFAMVEDISKRQAAFRDRQQAEEALRLSQQHYRSLTESLPQLVCMVRVDGMTEYCNQSWMKYTGLTLKQTQDSGWQQVIHPDDLPLAMKQWTDALENGNAYSLEFRIRRVDGAYRWHLSKIVPIQDEDGNIVAWLDTATDVDHQKRTEQRERFLAQASQTFAAASLDLQAILDTITRLVSELTDDVCVLSLLSEDGQWLDPASSYHVDPEVREFISELLRNYPRRADEGIGGRVIQTGEPLLMPVTSPHELRDAIKPEYQLYLEHFKVYSTLLVPLKVRGQTIGVLSLTRNHPGEPHNIDDQSLMQDLADRAAMAIANARLYQQAQQARQRAEQTADRTARLQAVTAALSESLTPAQVAEVIVEQSIAVLNASSAMVALVNEPGTELEIIHFVGYPQGLPEEWRRFPITTSVPLAEAIRTGEPIWEESTEERIARYPHLSENYAQLNYAAWISLPLMVEGRAVGGISLNFAQFSPLSDEDRGFMLALAQQCAQAIARAHLYEAEQRARTAAEEANRIKDEFLAVLSHELRSPLNPILGWTSLLRSRKLDQKATDRALETIERNAKLQTQLIEDLLDVSRILRGKLVLNVAPVNLVTTIEAALETVHLAAQAKTIQIQTRLDANVGLVLGDSSRLQQVIWNLLSNAVKFTPPAGQVEVRLERVGAYAQIQVKDNGKGISPEFVPYVFDYFRQADSTTTRKFGGLGLGLAIVRHLTELHGGSVFVDSPGEGLGATLGVRLPLMEAAVEAAPEVRGSDSADLTGLRVLVVDDEPDIRELVAFILEQWGAEVTIVASALEALCALNCSVPDILLSDIGMPEVDGYTLMRQVRALSPEQGGRLPAIALTAYAGEYNQQQALAAGFQLHVSKPVEPEELVKAIARLVGRVSS